jgi:hypothetical protein
MLLNVVASPDVIAPLHVVRFFDVTPAPRCHPERSEGSQPWRRQIRFLIALPQPRGMMAITFQLLRNAGVKTAR